MNNAEIITIGDELLIGQTIDTNSAWMGAELSLAGIRVNRITSISDRREEIVDALDNALPRASVILITGGLGPTSDDITKKTLADYFGARMVLNSEVLREVTDRLTRRGFAMNENNRLQAMVPDKCTVLMNKAGTAPGMLFRKGKKIIVSMPGVPHEMKYIMTEHLLPMLAETYSGKSIVHKNIMTYGIPEAMLAERLEQYEKEMPGSVKLAYLPAHGIIKLRLTCSDDSREKTESTIKNEVKKLYSIIPDVIYGEDEVRLEEAIGNLLLSKRMTVSTAESCTGGTIAAMITSVAGSSGWYKGSVIAYSNEVKQKLLGVREDTLEQHGAVSEQTVIAMAEGVRGNLGSDFALAVTGIAGPTGGTPEKPVGTVWMAVASDTGTVTLKQTFGDDRLTNITRSAHAALNLLRSQIIKA